MGDVVATQSLVKDFGRTRALDGLTFSVEQGEVHGFLGPNGAGKTTTLRILLGLVRADSGTASLLGGDPWRDAVDLHRRLAYVPGDVALWPNLTGGETIDLLGRLRGGLDAKRRTALLERFDLDPGKKSRAYSKGNRQKVALVAALASDVELLLFDEPTSGLDPLMEASFRDCVRDERERGRSVLLSSHILAEVEAVCDRVTIVRGGRVVESGALADLRHLSRTSVTAELAGDPTGLVGLPGVADLRLDGHVVRCEVDTAHLTGFVSRLAGLGVRSLECQPPTLEELFLRYYGRPGADPAVAGRTAGGTAGSGPVAMTGVSEPADRPAEAAGVGPSRGRPRGARRAMNALTGTGALVRVALRRSRLLLGGWVAVFVVMAAYSAKATVDLYPTVGSRIAAAGAVNRSQALVALYGRVYDPTSLGSLAMIKTGGIGAVFVALLSVVLVLRHTRADEESGRAELIGGGAVGRAAPLAAALTLVLAVDAVLAVLTAVSLTAAGLPAAGSVTFGLAWAAVGLAFAAVAAVAAQVATSARTATAICAALLAVVYLLRAAGDAAGESGLRWLTWLSPIGWSQQFRPYAGDRWWVLSVTLAFTLVTCGVAFALARGRDIGTGLLPDRGGPAGAGRSLRGPGALAWRLHRGALAGWGVGFAVAGVVFGALAANIGDFMNNASARDLLARLGGAKDLTDSFLAMEFAVAGILASAFGVQVVLRLRSEELGLRAEPVLAAAVGRVRWAMSHIVVALVGTTVLLALAGAGAGLARAVQSGVPSEAGRLLAAALVQLPAAWVLAALVVALFGLAPRFVALGWAALAAFVLAGELGALLGLSRWVMDLSPFAHVPRLPGAPFSPTPLVVLTAVAIALTVAGLAGLRHRDVGGA